jgi:hypothetical protein
VSLPYSRAYFRVECVANRVWLEIYHLFQSMASARHVI